MASTSTPLFVVNFSIFNSLICVKWLCVFYSPFCSLLLHISSQRDRALTFNYNSARCLQVCCCCCCRSSVHKCLNISTPVDALFSFQYYKRNVSLTVTTSNAHCILNTYNVPAYSIHDSQSVDTYAHTHTCIHTNKITFLKMTVHKNDQFIAH